MKVDQVDDRAALASLDPDDTKIAFLSEKGRHGWFTPDQDDDVGRPAEREADVTNDPAQIGIVPFSSDPTGATGAWVWSRLSRIDPRRAGAVGATGDGS